MRRKLIGVIAGILLGLSLNLSYSEPHFVEAIKYTKAAVEHGKMGHSSVLVENAVPALEQTIAGDLVVKNAKKSHTYAWVPSGALKSHADYAVTDLEESIKHGKMDHADIATQYAESALGHLEAANKQ